MQDARLKTILNFYGKAHQRIKLVEEIGEMLAEVGRYIADGGRRTNKADIISELADVVIVIGQLYPEAANAERKIRTSDDVARMLCEKAASLAALVAGAPYARLELSLAESTLALVDLFARELAEVPMLEMAIEQKLDRQIGRILKAEGLDGSSR